MKILNLYCGIGGNRKLWGDEHEVTAVEINESIANAYKKFFPNDNVVIGDAHKYLLEHFNEFDFIWSSPPCPSHSRFRKQVTYNRDKIPLFPDMKLYEEIIFLQHYFDGFWVVENVQSYYKPLIKPQIVNRHFIWSNLDIPEIKIKSSLNIQNGLKRDIGLDISGMKFTHRKDQIMSNCVEPELGLHILNCICKNSEGKNDL